MIRLLDSHPWRVLPCFWPSLIGAAIGCVALAWSASSHAQTWAGGRTTPSLGEIIAIDATGETAWPYGEEDIEGDGLGVFRPPEQSLDIRTAYAVTDASLFWTRVYVSDVNAVGGNVIVYVFIDADEDAQTGGSAAAPNIDPALDSDPSPGGYEYVVGIRGNGTLAGLYEWLPAGFSAIDPIPPNAVPEAGSDADPIELGALEHGYAQASVPLGAIGLTSDCAARLFVRSINTSASTTASDLNVGQASTCRPADANADGIPDTLLPPECTTDDQCPAMGICVDGACILAAPCQTDADCAADEACPDGLCVAVAQGTCQTTPDCGDLVCESGQCVPCTAGSCGTGRSCGPDGRCVEGTAAGPGGAGGTGAGGGGAGGGGAGGAESLVGPDEDVQGGACTCTTPGAADGSAARHALWGLAIAVVLARRRQSRGLR